MESDISMTNIGQSNTTLVRAAPFHVLDDVQERRVRSRSTTPGAHTPRDAVVMNVSAVTDQQLNMSSEIQNQLYNMQQAVNNVMQMQQQNNTTNVLQVFPRNDQAEVDALRNIADTAVLHAQATTAQAQLTVAALQQQAEEVVRNSEQNVAMQAQSAINELETRLRHEAAMSVQQSRQQMEAEVSQLFELKLQEMRLEQQKVIDDIKHERQRERERAVFEGT